MMNATTHPRLDAATIRALSVRASVDPRSIRRELAEPGSVRGMAGHRIRAALAELGERSPSPHALPLH